LKTELALCNSFSNHFLALVPQSLQQAGLGVFGLFSPQVRKTFYGAAKNSGVLD
jgi:hypothetical protein